MFVSFNADEIHALRVELSEKLNAMSPEEAARVFKESVTRAEAAIKTHPQSPGLDSRPAEAI